MPGWGLCVDDISKFVHHSIICYQHNLNFWKYRAGGWGADQWGQHLPNKQHTQ